MIGLFSKHSKNIAIKIILILVAISFVAWGANNLSTHSGAPTYALKIGNFEYSAVEFSNAFKAYLENLSQRHKIDLQGEGFDKIKEQKHVTGELIRRGIFANESQRLGLLVSDQIVKYQIANNESFFGEDGKFSKEIFDQAIRSSGLNEKAYIESLKRETGADLVFDPLFSYNLPANQAILQYIKAIASPREVMLYEVAIDKVEFNETVKDDDLKAFLAKHEDKFSTPETREFSYLQFGIKNVDQHVEISEDELKSQYQNRIYLFSSPERREVRHLLFSDVDTANTAKAKLDAGEKLEDVAQALKARNPELKIGDITREAFPKEVSDPIFALTAPGFTAPVKSPMGYHIFQVVEILPAKTLSYDEVKSSLEKQLRDEKLFERASELGHNIDIMISEGKKLEDVAATHKLELKKAKINKSAPPQDDSIIGSNPFITTGFATDKETTSMVTPLQDGEFFIVRTDEILPKQLKDVNEIKPELTNLFITSKKELKAAKYANAISQSIAAGKEIDPKIPFTVKNLTVSYNDQKGIAPELLKKVLYLSSNKATEPFVTPDGIQQVVKVISLKLLSDAEAEEKLSGLKFRYQVELSELMKTEYIDKAYSNYKVEINHHMMR
jgi:peptidyl-prolyl cis-trans isomerase D